MPGGNLSQMLEDLRRKRALQLQQIMQNSQISSALSPQNVQNTTPLGGVNPVDRSKGGLTGLVNTVKSAVDTYQRTGTMLSAMSKSAPEQLSAMQSQVPAGATEVPAAVGAIPADQMIPTAVSGFGAGAAAGTSAASGAAAGSAATAAGSETAASGLSSLLSFIFA